MPPLETRDLSFGKGVFALAPIPAGEHVLRYTGPFLTHAQTSPDTYAVQIGRDVYLGGSGGLDDYVNHACNPNCGLVITSPQDVVLVAIADIPAGQQITFDYSTTMDEDDFEFDCLCGSPICRKRIRDFKYLPVDRQLHYANANVVPPYNLRYLSC